MEPQIAYQLEITPIFIIKQISQGRAEGNKFIHSQDIEDCTIAIDPVIREGIVRIEFVFQYSEGYGRIMGIADASCSFAAGKGPSADRNDKKTVRYYNNGDFDHVTYNKVQNKRYEDEQRIAVEVDMTSNPRKVTFFVNEVEQQNYMINIPDAVRFYAYNVNSLSIFTVTKFQRLNKSSFKGFSHSRAFEWGKRWK
ncbi:MAG: hypothetical protein EZS28_013299 [Streblomastix strix]|uniref:B30.2/SPRY domain-containing protein n=1 Tax=Streblomastix strix TaxID=222440 RepID=A0A5J4W960_9EUKA|nr:MAG: hypothetical protein EZS28_013299 [Streblomastix strix]